MRVRLILLVALSAVLAAIALEALTAPVGPAGVEQDGAPATSAAPAGSAPPVRADLMPEAGRPFVLSADRTGQVVSIRPGTEARIEVHARRAASVQLGEDGPIEFAEPGTPAEFPVFGDASAEGPIRLLDPEREIGSVRLAR